MHIHSDRIDIDSRYSLAQDQINYFRENGFIKLKNVFTKDALEFFGDVITQKVSELNPLKEVPMEQRTITKNRSFKLLTFGKKMKLQGRLSSASVWRKSQQN